MARSVSYAPGAAWVIYCAPGLYNEEPCYACAAESGAVDPGCDVCGGRGEIEADYDTCKMRWDDFVGSLCDVLKRAFPSLEDCDEWLGREDHALLENRHAYIGVSEYCGVVSVWCVPKRDDYGNATPLAERWAGSIGPKVDCLIGAITTRLVRAGAFSNGEAVYVRDGA